MDQEHMEAHWNVAKYIGSKLLARNDAMLELAAHADALEIPMKPERGYAGLWDNIHYDAHHGLEFQVWNSSNYYDWFRRYVVQMTPPLLDADGLPIEKQIACLYRSGVERIIASREQPEISREIWADVVCWQWAKVPDLWIAMAVDACDLAKAKRLADTLAR